MTHSIIENFIKFGYSNSLFLVILFVRSFVHSFKCCEIDGHVYMGADFAVLAPSSIQILIRFKCIFDFMLHILPWWIGSARVVHITRPKSRPLTAQMCYNKGMKTIRIDWKHTAEIGFAIDFITLWFIMKSTFHE